MIKLITEDNVQLSAYKKSKAIEDYEKMQGNPDPRRVYRTEETPPELREMFLKELDRIADGGTNDE